MRLPASPDLPRETVLDAAVLATHFSQAPSPRAAVSLTRCRDVSKPAGSGLCPSWSMASYPLAVQPVSLGRLYLSDRLACHSPKGRLGCWPRISAPRVESAGVICATATAPSADEACNRCNRDCAGAKPGLVQLRGAVETVKVDLKLEQPRLERLLATRIPPL